jgi:hypothetical protein
MKFVICVDRVNVGEQLIRVAVNLPAGYLNVDQATAGRMVSSYKSFSF